MAQNVAEGVLGSLPNSSAPSSPSSSSSTQTRPFSAATIGGSHRHTTSSGFGAAQTTESPTQSTETIKSSASSSTGPNASHSDLIASKFLYGTTDLTSSSPTILPPITRSTSPTRSLGLSSSSNLEASPASMPVKMPQSSSSSGYTYPMSTSSPIIVKPQPRHTLEAPNFVYDVSGSNRILPRGTIKSVVMESAPLTQLAARSASTPASSSAFRASLESTGSSKLEKPVGSSKKVNKKKNSSSILPAPPPGSSVASVPMSDGDVQVAEFIGNRWPDALYQGWMKKRNKGKEATAKKRYLVVKTNCIEYYSDPQSANPKGVIYLDEIAVQFNETLRVVVKEKVWEFQAESERDLTRWHVVWRAVLSSLNK